MKYHRKISKLLIGFVLSFGLCACVENKETVFIDFSADAKEVTTEFFWKDKEDKPFKSIENLQKSLEKDGRKLRFAMNGGMYQEDTTPLGLFIQNHKLVTPLNLREAKGNFYLKPNGIFYITDDKRAFVVKTEDFKPSDNIKFATQSGPMLLTNEEINPLFVADSKNLNRRNGVCVLQDGKMFFSISERAVNFYDFAKHFKDAGCVNALYLDGYVSRMYLPEQNIKELDGDFGVIIGITE